MGQVSEQWVLQAGLFCRQETAIRPLTALNNEPTVQTLPSVHLQIITCSVLFVLAVTCSSTPVFLAGRSQSLAVSVLQGRG